MRKIIAFIALLIATAFVCGCSVPFMSTSAPHPTQTAVIPDQPTDEPTYTPLPIPSVIPATPTPRAEQSFAVSKMNIHWKTNAGTESDTLTFDITNDGAQTLTGLTAKYTVGTYQLLIDPVLGDIPGELAHVTSSTIGTLDRDQTKSVTVTLSGPNGAYSNEKPANATLTITWDGGSKTIFKKSGYQNPDYSNGDMSIADSDVYVPPPVQTGVVN
ncbi:MAG TPA: hypothetical protein VGK13_01455 [Methanocellaceae archaeon]|jgi:hypothetical protein